MIKLQQLLQLPHSQFPSSVKGRKRYPPRSLHKFSKIIHVKHLETFSTCACTYSLGLGVQWPAKPGPHPQRLTEAERRQTGDSVRAVWDFPGGPVVRTPRFQCKACGLAPGQGIEISHATWGSQKMLNDDGVMKWMEWQRVERNSVNRGQGDNTSNCERWSGEISQRRRENA